MALNPFEKIEEKLDALTNMVSELSRQVNYVPKTASETKPLNVTEAAAYIKVAKPTLYVYTCRRIIPHFKRGKRVFFYKTDLDNWLKSNRKKSIEEIEAEA